MEHSSTVRNLSGITLAVTGRQEEGMCTDHGSSAAPVDGFVIHCPKCGTKVQIRVSEREGEGENDDGDLVATNCVEAWAECPRHGWVSPRMDIRAWGPERFIDEPIRDYDREMAISGLREIMCGERRS